MNKKIVTTVVPDVHGREFWKEAISRQGSVVFLGDYLDPYSDEGITGDQAVENFREIIEFARKNRDSVHLLLGNHDMTYILGRDVCACRTIVERYDEIAGLFRDNAELFDLLWSEEINGKLFAYSHAGVSEEWLFDNDTVFSKTLDEELRHSDLMMNADIEKLKILRSALGDVSYYRGGYSRSGSVVWKDVREWKISKEPKYKNIVQVFGHTICSKGIMLTSETECVMTDSQAVYDIYDDATIGSSSEVTMCGV